MSETPKADWLRALAADIARLELIEAAAQEWAAVSDTWSASAYAGPELLAHVNAHDAACAALLAALEREEAKT